MDRSGTHDFLSLGALVVEGEGVSDALEILVQSVLELDTEAEKVKLLNEIRAALNEVSPMRHHPIDFVEWLPFDGVEADRKSVV